MKIDRIETIHLRYEYPAEERFRYAGGECTGRLTSLVRVHADNGAMGIGSAYSHPALVESIVKGQLEPMLVGEDPRDVEDLWKTMYLLTRWYGRKGAAMSAIGALDTAFWDLRGQASGKPIWSLLGGKQGRCPAYASALLWKEIDDLAEEAVGHLERGFRRMKMRLGRSEDDDIRAVRAVRAAIGMDNDLMVDASMRYGVDVARRIGRVLEENGVFWLEEPFQPEDHASYALLRGTIGVPLAAGENEFGAGGFRELIGAGAIDIVQPDASRAGGISEAHAVARMARDAGLRVATHSWSDAVAVIANAHVVAAAPNGITVEIDRTGNPFVERLLAEPLAVVDGQLDLGARPGLGITLDERLLDEYRIADPHRIPDGNYSDMVFGKQHYAPAEPYRESS